MVRELRRVRVGRRLARLHLLRLLRRIARLRGVPRPRGVARLPPVRSILRRCRLVLVLVQVLVLKRLQALGKIQARLLVRFALRGRQACVLLGQLAS